MANFPSINPDYGVRQRSSPNVKVIQFGDGYQQRVVFGLNQNLKSYSVTFRNLPETGSLSADTITDFLDDRAGDGTAFSWTAPGESSASKYICLNWDKTIPFPNRATITAEFRQVKEP
jgi:phage-related protein